MLPVEAPFKIYNDLNGHPLDNGYVYFGVAGQNPMTAPVTVYWDAAGIQPAAQPLRTTNGYIVRAGTPANVFIGISYSELVLDSKQRQVFYARTSDDFSIATVVLNFINSLTGGIGASFIGFIQSGIGALLRTMQDKAREWVSAADYATLSQAIAEGGRGGIFIPPNYSTTAIIDNPNNFTMLDFRHKFIGVWTEISPAYPVTGYPFGNDMNVRARGSADLYLEHFPATATTTTALSIGTNLNVPISAVSCGNVRFPAFSGTGGTEMFSTIAQLVIGRETANEEQVNAGSWSIVDANHINITCTKTHSGTTDIEQDGSTLLNIYDLYIGANIVKPSQMTTTNPGLRVKDLHGDIICKIPSDLGSALPYGAWQWGAIQTGLFGVNKDLYYQHALTTSKVIWRNNAGANIATLDNNGALAVVGGMSAGIGSAILNGVIGEVQFGRISAAITTNADAHVAWQNNTDPLNSSATAGGLLLSASGFASATINFATQHALRMVTGANGTLPGADNTLPLGSGAFRWSQLFAGTSVINTSDEREKQQITPINAVVLRAWAKVDYCQFRFNDAVELKGNGARWHIGVIAQRVKEAFESEGLDPFAYGILCYDEWDDQFLDLTDEEGNPTGEQRQIAYAGNRYGIRYEEALALECAYLRSRLPV